MHTDTDEQEKEKSSINLRVKTVQKTFDDIEQTSIKETTDSPTTLFPIHSSFVEMKTKTTDPEEQNDENLTAEVDKHPESISTHSIAAIASEEELIKKTDAIEQLSVLQKTKEDNSEEISSDFLTDIARQIITAAAIPHLSSDKPTVDKSPKDSLSEITEQPTVTTIDADNELFEFNETIPTTDDYFEGLSSNALAETIHEIHPTLTVENTTETTRTFKDIPNQLESTYSTSELINIMNSILSLPTRMLSKEFTNTPQQSETPDIAFRHFIPIVNEQSTKKKVTTDFTKIYYELQEQRQIQPLINFIPSEQKQETSTNHIEHFDLKSFSLISNLPSREYRQVFGVPDEVVNTIDDLTYYIDQTLSPIVSDEVKSTTFDSNEKPHIIEIFEDHQLIISPDQNEPIQKPTPSIISNVELDFRYTLLLDRINTFIKPLTDLPSSSFIIENELIPSKIEEEKDSSNVIDYATSMATNVISNIVSNLSLTTTTTNEETIITSSPLQSSTTDRIPSIDEHQEIVDLLNIESTTFAGKVQSPITTDGVIQTKEDDEQQEPTSTGLFQIVKNLLPSTLSSKTSTKSNSQTTPQYENIVENLADQTDLSSIISTFTTVLNDALSTVQNILPASITSSPDADQKLEVSKPSVSK
jgi:hypothetical protein